MLQNIPVLMDNRLLDFLLVCFSVHLLKENRRLAVKTMYFMQEYIADVFHAGIHCQLKIIFLHEKVSDVCENDIL